MAKEFEYEYNPIKEQVGGKAADKVIWSTSVILKALEGIQQGQPLKASPFLNKNTKLLKPELVRKYTQEEIEDYKRCATDPIYFASKCYLMTPEGLQACKLRDYQIDYIRHLQNNRFSIFLSCRQSGKSTTTAIYCLWVILFNSDKNGLILSKSGPAGVDLIKKIKDMYLYLPYHLKIGTMKWNQTEISFDNNSTIATESFSPTAGLGKTINFLILDEFAWCPPNDVELFYNNIIPTVTTITDSNVCIMSTQNGFNLFYKLWKGAIEKKNIYAPFKVDWHQVPQFNTETKQWEKRTEEWKETMIGILGSEEAFYYQYGTQFSASDLCLVSRECLSRLRDKAVLWENKTEELQELYNVHLQHHEHLYFRPDFDLILLKKVFFLITIDLAEGGGNDSTIFNIFQIVGKDKFKHVGYWKANSVDLEHAALEFWLLAGQLFNYERCMWSLEWNTYGALFYRMLMNLNEDDFDTESSYRFNIVFDGLELSNFVMYKKSSMDEQIIGKSKSTSNFIPGIKFTSGNKGTACSLLKILFEKEQIDTTDLISLGELENFEDKNGNGTYKASYGHDDLIMTFVQIPMVQQTGKYKSMIEEYIEATIEEGYNNKYNLLNSNNNDFFGGSMNPQMDTNDIFANRLGGYIPQQGGMYDIFDPTRNSNSLF
jgi:hypothetical protein